jgi:hypothetical protein
MTLFSRSLVPLLLFGLVLVGCDSGGGSVPGNLGDSTTVGFDKTSATVVEGEKETYDLTMVANDPGFEKVRFDLSVDAQQSTAELGEDITGLTGDTTVAFPQSAASGGTASIPLGIVDEPVDSTGFLENTETLSLTLSAADTLAPENIEQGQMNFTLTIEEDDDPLTVEESRTRPSGGRTVVDALVTRVEPDSGAYLQDGTGGLFVADPDFVSGSGLAASAGDSVRVDGTVGYVDGVFRVSDASAGALTQELTSGNVLPSPQSVSLRDIVTDGEGFESELVRLPFTIDSGGDNAFQSGNYTISANDTTSTLRIPSSSEITGQEIPDRALFQGVVGQSNDAGRGGDEPDEGYQLLGLQTGDVQSFETVLSVAFDDGTLSPMTTFSVASNNDWEATSPPVDSAPLAEASGFGGNEPANDWLITPALDFSNLSVETLTFLSYKGFDDSERRGLQVKVSTDYSGSGDPTNATWVDVSSRVTFADNGGSGFSDPTSSGQVDLSDMQFQDSDVYVAFQYRSSGTSSGNAATWQIDNIAVSGVPSN